MSILGKQWSSLSATLLRSGPNAHPLALASSPPLTCQSALSCMNAINPWGDIAQDRQNGGHDCARPSCLLGGSSEVFVGRPYSAPFVDSFKGRGPPIDASKHEHARIE